MVWYQWLDIYSGKKDKGILQMVTFKHLYLITISYEMAPIS